MNDKLIQLMDQIDDKYIEEIICEPTIKRKITPIVFSVGVALCAALLVVIFIGFLLDNRPMINLTKENDLNSQVAVQPTENSFYIESCGITYNTNDSYIILSEAEGQLQTAYCGCFFQVKGENISQIKLSISQGELFTAYFSDEPIPESPMLYYDCNLQGNTFCVPYDESQLVGFHIPDDIRTESMHIFDLREGHIWAMTEAFDQATLTIDVTYLDESIEQKVFIVHVGKLGCDEDGTLSVYSGEGPYIYGIYLQDVTEVSNPL